MTVTDVNTAVVCDAPRVRRVSPMVAMLAVGVLVRIVLVPISYGQDFVVWDLVARSLLHGRDFYAHRPAGLPGGPYGYLPLFAYAEVPFRFLANVLPISFGVLGKLPILAGDAGVAWGIATWCRRRGVDERSVVLAVGLWWLNPLVLYNGAFYGRFDSVCLALLFAALLAGPPTIGPDGRRSRGPIWFGLAVAAKTFPAFLLPWFVRNGRERGRMVWRTVLTASVVSLPFIVLSPVEVLKATLLYDANKTPTNLSWQIILAQVFGGDMTRAIGTFILLGFFVSLFALTTLELTEYCCAGFCAFIVFSKIVNEQYLVWALPFLVLLYVTTRHRAHARMFVMLTAIGSLVNPFVHPFGQQGTLPTVWVNVLLAVATSWYLVWMVRARHAQLRSQSFVTLDDYLDFGGAPSATEAGAAVPGDREPAPN